MKRILISTLVLCTLLTGCDRVRGIFNKEKAGSAQDSTIVDGGAAEAPQTQPTDTQANMDTTAKEAALPIAEEPVLNILTSMGNIKIKLYKETPLHRDNFVHLARKGYYNGLLFHRVIPGFMIQTGDPFTRDTTKVNLYGSGGPNYTIPAEIVEGLKHKKGAIAAARRGDSVNPERASSGSQFYIVQDAEGCSHLDGQYTVFGEVIDGLQVVDNIANVETNVRDLPLYPITIISIKEER